MSASARVSDVPEVFAGILQLLSLRDLHTAQNVSRQFRSVARGLATPTTRCFSAPLIISTIILHLPLLQILRVEQVDKRFQYAIYHCEAIRQALSYDHYPDTRGAEFHLTDRTKPDPVLSSAITSRLAEPLRTGTWRRLTTTRFPASPEVTVLFNPLLYGASGDFFGFHHSPERPMVGFDYDQLLHSWYGGLHATVDFPISTVGGMLLTQPPIYELRVCGFMRRPGEAEETVVPLAAVVNQSGIQVNDLLTLAQGISIEASFIHMSPVLYFRDSEHWMPISGNSEELTGKVVLGLQRLNFLSKARKLRYILQQRLIDHLGVRRVSKSTKDSMMEYEIANGLRSAPKTRKGSSSGEGWKGRLRKQPS